MAEISDMEKFVVMGEQTKQTKQTERVILPEASEMKARGVDNYKNFLPRVAASSPSIIQFFWSVKENDNGESYYDGNVQCIVPLSDLGLTQDDFYMYRNELFSPFIVDFMGELTIRHNLGFFINQVLSRNAYEYIRAVSCHTHQHFGMRLNATGEGMILLFHISIVQSILTENIKSQVIKGV